MKDYNVSITVYVAVSALNDTMVQARAAQIAESITLALPPNLRWLGEIEYGEPEIEEA